MFGPVRLRMILSFSALAILLGGCVGYPGYGYYDGGYYGGPYSSGSAVVAFGGSDWGGWGGGGYRRNGGGWHGDHRPYHRAHGHRHGRYRY